MTDILPSTFKSLPLLSSNKTFFLVLQINNVRWSLRGPLEPFPLTHNALLLAAVTRGALWASIYLRGSLQRALLSPTFLP